MSSSTSSRIARSDHIQAIIIDCEHGHVDDRDMHTATTAIAALGVSPLVRLRSTHSDLIKRALDAGAQYVILAGFITIADKTH